MSEVKAPFKVPPVKAPACQECAHYMPYYGFSMSRRLMHKHARCVSYEVADYVDKRLRVHGRPPWPFLFHYADIARRHFCRGGIFFDAKPPTKFERLIAWIRRRK